MRYRGVSSPPSSGCCSGVTAAAARGSGTRWGADGVGTGPAVGAGVAATGGALLSGAGAAATGGALVVAASGASTSIDMASACGTWQAVVLKHDATIKCAVQNLRRSYCNAQHSAVLILVHLCSAGHEGSCGYAHCSAVLILIHLCSAKLPWSLLAPTRQLLHFDAWLSA